MRIFRPESIVFFCDRKILIESIFFKDRQDRFDHGHSFLKIEISNSQSYKLLCDQEYFYALSSKRSANFAACAQLMLGFTFYVLSFTYPKLIVDNF